jgi:hypothetical protein
MRKDMSVPAKAVAAVADHGRDRGRSRLPHAPNSYPLFDLPATALAAWRDANKGGGVRAAVWT